MAKRFFGWLIYLAFISLGAGVPAQRAWTAPIQPQVTVDDHLHATVEFTPPVPGPYKLRFYAIQRDNQGRLSGMAPATPVLDVNGFPYKYEGNGLLGKTEYFAVVKAGTAGQEEEYTGHFTVGNIRVGSSSSGSPFRLRKVFDGDWSDEPATISFVKEKGADPTYSLEFAGIWEPTGKPYYLTRENATDRAWILPNASIEGRFGSNSVSEDALRIRVGGNLTTQHGGDLRFDYGTRTLFHAKFESDQALRTKKVSGEVLFTPTVPSIALGQYVDWGKRAEGPPRYQFKWRPVVGVDAGTTLERGRSKEAGGGLLRALAQGGAVFRINPKGNNLKHIDLTADEYFYYLPLESGDSTHSFFRTSLIFHFSDRFSFSTSYKVGEDSPTFKKVETVEAGFGLKF